MLLSLVSLLLLLLVSGLQASHFLGTMMTYYPGETRADGSISVLLRYKLNFALCSHSATWQCGGNCGTQTQSLALSKVEEVSGEWCQNEGEITHLLPINTGFQSVLAGGNWIDNIQNGIVSWRAVTNVELRNRSDTNKPNTSPQSTILPALRIPSNCARNITLLAFDPDGDEVRCRFGITSDLECNPCTPPSVLSLASSCSLSFSPTNSITELPYAVQLVIEDFPSRTIVLTQTDGAQVVKNTSEAISKIPLQFVLKVVPTVPSCVEGVYLPRFLPPTPEHRAQLFTPAGQAIQITIRAEATQSVITGLLFSGPHDAQKNSSGSGNYSLTWTPSAREAGQSHPICFVVQANVFNTSIHSDLRCVIVTVGNAPPVTTANTPFLTTPQMTVTTPNATAAINITSLQTVGNTIATTPATTTTTTPTLAISTPTNTPFLTTPQTTVTTQNSTAAVNITSLQTVGNTIATTPTTTTTPTATTTSAISTPTSITTAVPGPQYVIALKMKISTTLSMETDSDTILALIKNRLVAEGLPSTITIRLLSSGQVIVTTARP